MTLPAPRLRYALAMPFPATVEKALALGGQFVKEYWPGLAARAWNGFKEHGSGVVLVPWAVVEDWDERRKAGRSAEMHFAQYTTGPTWAPMVDGYDPQKEIIVAFCEEQVPDGSGIKPLTGRFAWRRFASGDPPPSMAARLPRIRPN